MAREKEIKIKLIGITLDEFISRINKKGFTLEKTINQLDIYFDTKDWYLYKHIAALRIRIVNNIYDSLSFKKVFFIPNKKDNYFVEETETKAPFKNTQELAEIFDKLKLSYNNKIFKSGKNIVSFLKKYKYHDEQKMPKVRQIFKNGGDEIVIDDVDQVGIIIELECKENEPLEFVKTLLDDFEWERNLEGTSYVWLKKVKGLTSHIESFKRFKKEPAWNVWKHEQKMYKELIAN